MTTENEIPKWPLTHMNVQRVWAVPDDTVVGGYRALDADVCEDLGLDSTGRWG